MTYDVWRMTQCLGHIPIYHVAYRILHIAYRIPHAVFALTYSPPSRPPHGPTLHTLHIYRKMNSALRRVGSSMTPQDVANCAYGLSILSFDIQNPSDVAFRGVHETLLSIIKTAGRGALPLAPVVPIAPMPMPMESLETVVPLEMLGLAEVVGVGVEVEEVEVEVVEVVDGGVGVKPLLLVGVETEVVGGEVGVKVEVGVEVEVVGVGVGGSMGMAGSMEPELAPAPGLGITTATTATAPTAVTAITAVAAPKAQTQGAQGAQLNLQEREQLRIFAHYLSGMHHVSQ
jgi:hypothetical protein